MAFTFAADSRLVFVSGLPLKSTLRALAFPSSDFDFFSSHGRSLRSGDFSEATIDRLKVVGYLPECFCDYRVTVEAWNDLVCVPNKANT
jgi:hypothetical protein